MKETPLTLYELNRLVREVIECEMPREYWVEAELSECRESRGHCYMELVQKGQDDRVPMARASAKCWASQWTLIHPHFERITGQRMHAGMKVLLKVYPQFHEAYGFSWIVTDIDPTYTMGDIARKRQEIVIHLKQEGIFDLQRELKIPLFCQRIAVISSETAAGYGDFVRQLSDSPFQFSTRLFPAIMQGEQVEQSIIDALNRIYEEVDLFDTVVIIRGGGATSDFSGFDTLALAENIAQFPLPIITGIGHDRDECILDMVSHLRVKTPTAAATALIDHLQQVFNCIEEAQERIVNYLDRRIQKEKLRLSSISANIPAITLGSIGHQQIRLSRMQERIGNVFPAHIQRVSHHLEILERSLIPNVQHILEREQHILEIFGQRINALDPSVLLQRGYSITMCQGRAIRSANDVKPGDIIETRLQEGTIQSKII